MAMQVKAGRFAVNWSTTDATQRQQLFLAFGSAAAAAAAPSAARRALLGVGY